MRGPSSIISQSFSGVGNELSRKLLLLQTSGRRYIIIIFSLYVAMLAFVFIPISAPGSWTTSNMEIYHEDSGNFTCSSLDARLGPIMSSIPSGINPLPAGVCEGRRNNDKIVFNYNYTLQETFHIHYGLFSDIQQSYNLTENLSIKAEASHNRTQHTNKNHYVNGKLPYGYILWSTLNPHDISKVQNAKVFSIFALLSLLLQIIAVIIYCMKVKRLTQEYMNPSKLKLSGGSDDENSLSVYITILKGIRVVFLFGLINLICLIISVLSWL